MMNSDGYKPHGSGFLQGGGVYKSASKYLLKLSDVKAIKGLPPFDERKQYSKRQLLVYTEKFLIEDEKSWEENPQYLPMTTYIRRLKREIYTSVGTPDPSIVSGIYNRSHPNGRPLRTDRRQGFFK